MAFFKVDVVCSEVTVLRSNESMFSLAGGWVEILVRRAVLPAAQKQGVSV